MKTPAAVLLSAFQHMTNPGTILLVEDDESLGFVIKDNLEINHYLVDWIKNGEDVMKSFQKGTYDLILLDVMLPKVDGFELAERIREQNTLVPIIFISARSMVEDRIEGLKKGGDDYLNKPFSMEELLLKIRNFIKRANLESGAGQNNWPIGEYLFKPADLKLIWKDQERILTKKEAEVLELLCKNKGRPLKREDILNNIWGENDYFLGRSLDVFISRLRKYLKNDPSVNIVNLHGVGFKLEPE